MNGDMTRIRHGTWRIRVHLVTNRVLSLLLMSQEFVLSFEHIETMSQPEKALELLKRITSLVKPIMRSHHWTLPTLAEFFPDEQNLLGRLNDQPFSPISSKAIGLSVSASLSMWTVV